MARKFADEPAKEPDEYIPDPDKIDTSPDIDPEVDESEEELKLWKPPEYTEQEKQENAQLPDTIAKMLTDATARIHILLADYTKYEKWRLTENESESWLSFWSQVAPYIPLKYFGLIIASFVLIMIEITKINGYSQFRKNRSPE